MTREELLDHAVCAYCGRPAEGNYSIHRDAFCDGPEVDLCDACGSDVLPTCTQIWARISRGKGGGE